MSYPCNECGIVKSWSLFCNENDKLTIGYKALDPTFSNSTIDGIYIISYYPLSDKSYKTVLEVRINGSGGTVHAEKLK